MKLQYSKHYMIGLLSGQNACCLRWGKPKQNYKTKERAEQSAIALMKKQSGKILEAYPCVWCQGWHIGRKMTLLQTLREAVVRWLINLV
jgi:hypothetical protein